MRREAVTKYVRLNRGRDVESMDLAKSTADSLNDDDQATGNVSEELAHERRTVQLHAMARETVR